MAHSWRILQNNKDPLHIRIFEKQSPNLSKEQLIQSMNKMRTVPVFHTTKLLIMLKHELIITVFSQLVFHSLNWKSSLFYTSQTSQTSYKMFSEVLISKLAGTPSLKSKQVLKSTDT